MTSNKKKKALSNKIYLETIAPFKDFLRHLNKYEKIIAKANICLPPQWNINTGRITPIGN